MTEMVFGIFFFFKQKTAYEIGTGDWSSDVCSSDLLTPLTLPPGFFAFSTSFAPTGSVTAEKTMGISLVDRKSVV